MILIVAWLIANQNLKKSYSIWKVFIILVLFGIIIELLQRLLTQYRTMDWKDALANTLGLFIGLMLHNFYFKRINL
jgi:VanZ family protein